jgi:hypothetical protein
VTFAEKASVLIDEMDAERAPVFQPEDKRNVDPIGEISVWLNGSFDTEESWDGKAGSFHHSLIAADLVAYFACRLPATGQFSEAGVFFDEFHHPGGILPYGGPGNDNRSQGRF